MTIPDGTSYRNCPNKGKTGRYMLQIERALLSVSDKSGLVDFAGSLNEMGVELISTGGTASILSDNGIPLRLISDVTGSPEILSGRVKTLHPSIFAGLLALRDNPFHMTVLEEVGAPRIDLVAVNLYPFVKTITGGCSLEEALENIDIGGVSLIRAAAKNHRAVCLVTDPTQYELVTKAMRNQGGISDDLLLNLAIEGYRVTAEYDQAILGYLKEQRGPGALEEEYHLETLEAAFTDGTAPTPAPAAPAMRDDHLPGYPGEAPAPAATPPTPAAVAQPPVSAPVREIDGWSDPLGIELSFVKGLRYGENPHQRGALYRRSGPMSAGRGGISAAEKVHGMEMSFNNYLDAHAAYTTVLEFDDPAVVVLKHTNPCGVASDSVLADAYSKALECDRKSAFGGIIAANRMIDSETAKRITKLFTEVVIAPGYESQALEILRKKKNMRVLQLSPDQIKGTAMFRFLGETVLVQEGAEPRLDDMKVSVPTSRHPTRKEWEDLKFTWLVAKHVKSNAIVIGKGRATVGIGAGQMARVGSVKIALVNAGKKSKGSVLASDGFFPFRDSIDGAADAGITAIIQPGGSIKDKQVVRAANEHGLAMVFTKYRTFYH